AGTQPRIKLRSDAFPVALEAFPIATAEARWAEPSYKSIAVAESESWAAPIASHPFTVVSGGGLTAAAASSPRRSRTAFRYCQPSRRRIRNGAGSKGLWTTGSTGGSGDTVVNRVSVLLPRHAAMDTAANPAR